MTKLLFENTNIFIEAINHYFKKATVSLMQTYVHTK